MWVALLFGTGAEFSGTAQLTSGKVVGRRREDYVCSRNVKLSNSTSFAAIHEGVMPDMPQIHAYFLDAISYASHIWC
jgi:hypothetical protein